MSDLAAFEALALAGDEIDFGELTVKNRVYVRDHLGRFIDHIHAANRKSTEEALALGTQVAFNSAPKKTGHMASTIHYRMLDDKMGEIVVGSDHWGYQEFGTPTHDITGRVRFWWERENRMWTPGSNTITHPGNRAVHFMRHGFDAAMDELPRAMERNYGRNYLI